MLYIIFAQGEGDTWIPAQWYKTCRSKIESSTIYTVMKTMTIVFKRKILWNKIVCRKQLKLHMYLLLLHVVGGESQV